MTRKVLLYIRWREQERETLKDRIVNYIIL